MTNINSYQTPEQGTLDWHIPLNENFEMIETDVQNLASELGVSDVGGYNTPSQGTLDWHIPLNENFETIESDIQALATEAGVSDVGGYNRPSQGTLDWHIPLNENFEMIAADMRDIANATGSELSGKDTLSNTDVWLSLLQSGTDLSNVVYDATTFSGATLAQQVENTLSAMRSDVDGRAVLWVPSGSYTWDRTVNFDTGSVLGPTFHFSNEADIEVTADWAFDFQNANTWSLANDQRTSVRIRGGKWTISGTGLARSEDIYRGFFSPASVTGGTHALWSRNSDSWSEGWTVRDATFEGVDEPLRFSSAGVTGGSGTGSHDQQLLANITFSDFSKAVHYEGANCQNHTSAELRFENPRSGAIGMHFGLYATGTVYHPVWTGSTGTLFRFDDWSKPSIVDADVASGADLFINNEGGDPTVTSGESWTQGHLSPIITDGGPTVPTPVVRTDSYSGDLPAQVEAAAADLPSGGTVIIAGQGTHTLGSTVSISLNSRDINIVVPPNAWIDVTTSGWALEVTGDGHFGVHGGFWVGNDSSLGWLKTDVPKLDASPTEVRDFGNGSGIDAAPRSKGKYRIFDTRFIHTTNNSGNPGSVACVQIGGAGCSQLLMSHTETENITTGYRFNAPIDDFDGMRLSAHPWNDGAVFADTNAALGGTWFNTKWEAPGVANSVMFDNSDTSSPADVTEPWVWAGDEGVDLWKGTKPGFYPDVSVQTDTKFEP
jgi:hypothetical protein